MAIEEEEGNEIRISASETASTLTIKENGLEFCEAVELLQKTENNPVDSDKTLYTKCPLNMIKSSPLKVPAKQLLTIKEKGLQFCQAVGLLQQNKDGKMDSDKTLPSKYPLNTITSSHLRAPAKHILTKVENEMKDPKRFAEEKAVLSSDCDFCYPNAEFMENLLKEIENEAKKDNSSYPYLEYIKMCEKNIPKEKCDLCRKKQQKDKHTPADLSQEASTEVKTNPKSILFNEPSTSAKADRSDIFGNNFSSKARNKISVNCPHCKKKVSAPQFVRHLCYCMGAGIRKRTRRSCTSS